MKRREAAFRAFLGKVQSGQSITQEDFRKLIEARGDCTPEQVARHLADVNMMLEAFGLPPLEKV